MVMVAGSATCHSASVAYDAELGISEPAAPVIVLKLGSKLVVIKEAGWESAPLNIPS